MCVFFLRNNFFYKNYNIVTATISICVIWCNLIIFVFNLYKLNSNYTLLRIFIKRIKLNYGILKLPRIRFNFNRSRHPKVLLEWQHDIYIILRARGNSKSLANFFEVHNLYFFFQVIYCLYLRGFSDFEYLSTNKNANLEYKNMYIINNIISNQFNSLIWRVYNHRI